jgi:hypothetical protein
LISQGDMPLARSWGLTSFLFLLNLRNDRFNLRQIEVLRCALSVSVTSPRRRWRTTAGTNSNFPIALHNADLDVLGTSLNNFEQTFNRQFDAFLSRQIVFVVLLEELADGLG